jgi:hypothetical protein
VSTYNPNIPSAARIERRKQIANIALSLVGQKTAEDFDPVHSPICSIDVVMVAGSPWLTDGLEKDYWKDESGYKKIGGGSNNPSMHYFFRSIANLLHYLKRQGFYIPRGELIKPEIGMACFFDFEERGRFNFTPDRCGLITSINDNQISEVVISVKQEFDKGFEVKKIVINSFDKLDEALIGYSDLP